MRKGITLLFSLSLILTACGGNNDGQNTASQQNGKTTQHPRLEQIQSEPGKLKIQEVNPSETQHGKTKIETIGFLEPTDAKQAAEEVRKVGKHLTYVAFFSYRVKKDGTLHPIKDEAALEQTKKSGATPMMVLTNFTEGNFSPDLAHQLFIDKAASKALIRNVLDTMKKKGYKALNIDFEHIKAKDRELYNGFLETILPKVRDAGYIVSTALAPKTSDEQSGPWHGAHDYKRHGELADFVVLMTYEWGWSGGPPRAVAPLPQVRAVLDYAKSVIPPEKIVMGAPLYGYDWTLPYKKGGKFAKRLAPKAAEDLATKENVDVKFDNKSMSPHFNYTDDKGKKHEVWFENEQSMQAKYKLAKQYGLHGVAYWVLGEEFPENWALLEDQFTVQKKK